MPVSTVRCWINVCIVKGWMDVLPIRYTLLSGSHSIWLVEMTLSCKENRKTEPKYISNSNTYILESEKKKSCSVDLYRCLEVIWWGLSRRWSLGPCRSERGHQIPLWPHPLEMQLLLGAALQASFTSNNQCVKVKAGLQDSRDYTDENQSRNCPAASVFLISMQKPEKMISFSLNLQWIFRTIT